MNLITTNQMYTTKRSNFESLALGVLLTLSASQIALANENKFGSASSQWQPVASDKLVKLPANIIEKRIQKDFKASAMATRMTELDIEMQEKVAVIKSIIEVMPELEGEIAQNQRFELLQYKSEYLDSLQESHYLHQSALEKKQKLYKTWMRSDAQTQNEDKFVF